MPSSLNALIAAWAVSLILIVGTTLFFELTYDPAASEAIEGEQQAENRAEDQPQQMANAEPTTMNAPDDGQVAGAQPATSEQKMPGEAEDAATQPPVEDDARPQRQDPETGLVEAEPTRPTPEPRATTALRTGVKVEANPALIEQSNQGPLPRRSEDGKTPFQEYAAPRPVGDTRPKIAIVITDLGQRSRMTRRAISDLPPAVSFAFSPYASNLMEYGEQSRRTGHEVLLMVPMEPINYPQHDPGPFSLLTSRSPRENISLLRSSLGRLTGYVGVINHMGSRFTAASESLKPVLEELNRRGLMFVDARATQYSLALGMARSLNMPSSYNNKFIDDDPNADEIAKQLADLEGRARIFDYAVGVGRPYPVTFDAVKVWAAGLNERGFVLVPISATANQQPLPR
ncbi:MAG: divergent polysaccharide deacetylase family protein [Alphaproteobacteria bacterium]|nr:divergent polysaccharide deacetylase family protein [Alphaproteobacteria bacterium]